VHVVATIGYEQASIPGFLEALLAEGVELVVDVRAVASSRRPGFSKNKLAANLAGAGIEYLHLRGLGTPAEGRLAARSGRHEEMRAIYQELLAGQEAQDDLETLKEIVESGRRVCLLCLEANPTHCHRSMIVEALKPLVPIDVHHLFTE
jgi:uncharacterized protein (DUF488 family)